MDKRDVYLKAAKRISMDLKAYSCNTILHYGDGECERLYRDVFELGNGFSNGSTNVEVMWHMDKLDLQNLRIWLLCMMAACCDDMEGL